MYYSKASSLKALTSKAYFSMNSGEWDYLVFEDINDMEELWRSIQPYDRQLLQFDFLSALQRTPPFHMSFLYGILLLDKKLVGCVSYQRVHFNLLDSIKKEDNPKSSLCGFFRSKIEVNLLVCGNFLSSGNNAFHFLDKNLESEGIDALVSFSELLLERLQKEKEPLKALFFKDLCAQDTYGGLFESKQYTSLEFQPKMLMKIDTNWQKFEDYLGSLSSKYRVRVRRARKKAEGISYVSFKKEDIFTYQDQIWNLFNQVLKNASFNALNLQNDFFYRMKEEMEDQYQFVAYFKEDKLVGFYTVIHGSQQLEAHYLGYDPEVNRKSQLYLNMLLDILSRGIKRKYTSINFSRTATEIKSSLGALPVNVKSYYKHKTPLLQSFFSRFYPLVKPNLPAFKLRSPFVQTKQSTL